MKRIPLPLALVATAALLWRSVTPAQACTCAMGTVEEQVSNASTIVLGTVEHARLSGTEEYAGVAFPRIQVTLSVERYLKGHGADSITVNELGSPCSVLHPRAEGARYLLFLQGTESPFAVEGVCAGSSLIYDIGDLYPEGGSMPESAGAAFLLEQEQWIGDIFAVTGSGVAPESSNPPTLPLAVAAVAVPLAFVLVASFVFPAQRSRA